MIDNSGRLRDTSIRSMSRMLLTLTTLYPGFDLKNGPRINVVFTNFNKFKNNVNIDYLSG